MKKEQQRKYRELVELKGYLRQEKINYEMLAKGINMSLSAFSNKINGKTVFDIIEVQDIINFAGIPKDKIPLYFF